jgi:hypothetical protein
MILTCIELIAYVEYKNEVREISIMFDDFEFDGACLTNETEGIDIWEEFIKEFGNEYYESLEDYRNDNVKLFSDWVKEYNLNITPEKD